MRGNRRHVATVLVDALKRRPEARLATAAAAFAEALGRPLAREVQLRAFTRDGRLIAVAASERWADQARALAPAIVERMNGRLGVGSATALEVRVGAMER
jgi:hypothetical protein